MYPRKSSLAQALTRFWIFNGWTRRLHTVPADRNNEKRPNRVAPTPDANSITLWRILAARYRDEPVVLFDLFNEPHNRLDDDFLPIYLIAPGGEVLASNAHFVGPEDWYCGRRA